MDYRSIEKDTDNIEEVDEKHTLEHYWKTFHTKVLDWLPPELVEQLRMVFYSGALAASMLSSYGDDITTEQAVARVAKMHEDLNNFRQDVAFRAMAADFPEGMTVQ